MNQSIKNYRVIAKTKQIGERDKEGCVTFGSVTYIVPAKTALQAEMIVSRDFKDEYMEICREMTKLIK